jgi:2,4-dienoyl-CoA reductase (NADPH2)
MKGVVQLGGVTCEEVLPGGLRIITGPQRADPRLIAADAVVLCTGQEPERALAAALAAAGLRAQDRGAAGAAELDAQRAIDEGTRLGAAL